MSDASSLLSENASTIGTIAGIASGIPGGGAIGGAIGGLVGGAFGKKKKSAMELLREKAIMDADKLGKKSIPLSNQMADYAKTIGTKEDALFHGGLAATKFKEAYGRSMDAGKRNAARYGLKPGSGAYRSMTSGSSPAEVAFGESKSFNTALLDRINSGMAMRSKALGGISTGQQNLLASTQPAASLDADRFALEELQNKKKDDLMGGIGGMLSGQDGKVGEIGTFLSSFGGA